MAVVVCGAEVRSEIWEMLNYTNDRRTVQASCGAVVEKKDWIKDRKRSKTLWAMEPQGRESL